MATRLYNLNVKQLDNAIAILDKKMAESKKDDFMIRKLQQMKNEYVKVENKILRYYDKARRKYPNMVEGKKNTLTLLKVLELQNKKTKPYNLDKGNKVKEAKWNYNFFDAVEDTKGLIVGTGATIVGIGVADLIAKGVTKDKGIFPLIFEGLKAAFDFDAFGMSMLTIGGAAIGAALAIPKIRNKAHQIKNNIAHSREASNEVFKKLSEDEVYDEEKLKSTAFDKSKKGMIDELINNPDLLKSLQDKLKKKDLDGLSPAQKVNLQILVNAAEAEVKNLESQLKAKKNKAAGEKATPKKTPAKTEGEIRKEAEEKEVENVAKAIEKFYEAIETSNKDNAPELDKDVEKNSEKDLSKLLSSYDAYALLVGESGLAKQYQSYYNGEYNAELQTLKDLNIALKKDTISTDDLKVCLDKIFTGDIKQENINAKYKQLLTDMYGDKSAAVIGFLTDKIHRGDDGKVFIDKPNDLKKSNPFGNVEENFRNITANFVKKAIGNPDLSTDPEVLGKIYQIIMKKASLHSFEENGKLNITTGMITDEERAFAEAYHAKYVIPEQMKTPKFGDADWKNKFDLLIINQTEYKNALDVLKTYFGDDLSTLPAKLEKLDPKEKAELANTLKTQNPDKFKEQVDKIIEAQKGKGEEAEKGA